MKLSKRHVLHLWLVLAAPLTAQAAEKEVEPIPLMGSNGRVVAFAGVKESRPDGLVVRVKEDSDEITVKWDLLDLEDMKTRQPEIFKAAEKSIGTNVTVPLMLGLYGLAETYAESLADFGEVLKKHRKFYVPIEFSLLLERNNFSGRRLADFRKDYNVLRRRMGGNPTLEGILKALSVPDENERVNNARILHYVLSEPRNKRITKEIIDDLEEMIKGLPSPLYEPDDRVALSFPNDIRNLIGDLKDIERAPRADPRLSDGVKRFYDRIQTEFERMGVRKK